MTIDIRSEDFNLFKILHDTDIVDTYTEHTVYVAGYPWGLNDWLDKTIRFTSGELNQKPHIVISSKPNSITCTESFIGQVFPATFPFDLSELSNSDSFEIIDVARELDLTTGGHVTFPIMLGGYFTGIILPDDLISTQPIIRHSVSYGEDFNDSFYMGGLLTFPYSFWTLLDNPITPDSLPSTQPIIRHSVSFGEDFNDGFNLYPLMGFPYSFWTQFHNPTFSDIPFSSQPIIRHSVSFGEDFSDGFGIGLILKFPFKFGYTINPLWNGYRLSGVINPCANNKFNVDATVRVTNIASNRMLDMRTNTLGEYDCDLSNMASLFSDGSVIRVSTYNNQYQDFTVDYYNDIQPRIMDDMSVCFVKPAEVDTANMMSFKIKKAISGTTGRFEGIFENKNGRRSGDYACLQPITVKTDDNTVFKGKVLDVDLSTKHILKLTAEDYNSQLHNSYTIFNSFISQTIYYALTDSINGILPGYLPDLDISQIPNNVDTQRTFTHIFEKEPISDVLEFLGSISSDLGYEFYIDEYETFHFEERKIHNSGIQLTNTGTDRNVINFDYKNSGQDIYNSILIYGSSNLFPYRFPFQFGVIINFPLVFPYEFGGQIIEIINDDESQTIYGVREHPPISNLNISSVNEANYIGNNIFKLKSLPTKDITVDVYNRYKKHTFDLLGYEFPISFTYRSGVADLEPGDIVTIDFTNSGIPVENLFPWTFTTQFSPQDKVIREIEYKYPESISTIKFNEYFKDLKTVISRNLNKI